MTAEPAMWLLGELGLTITNGTGTANIRAGDGLDVLLEVLGVSNQETQVTEGYFLARHSTFQADLLKLTQGETKIIISEQDPHFIKNGIRIPTSLEDTIIVAYFSDLPVDIQVNDTNLGGRQLASCLIDSHTVFKVPPKRETVPASLYACIGDELDQEGYAPLFIGVSGTSYRTWGYRIPAAAALSLIEPEQEVPQESTQGRKFSNLLARNMFELHHYILDIQASSLAEVRLLQGAANGIYLRFATPEGEKWLQYGSILQEAAMTFAFTQQGVKTSIEASILNGANPPILSLN